jgi:hypothetical protein
MNPYFDTRFFVDEYGTDQAALFGNNPYNDYCKPDEPCMPSLPCEE